MRKVVVFGATSAIAQALARRLATEGDRMFLVARHADRLQALRTDLLARGAGRVDVLEADLDDGRRHAELVQRADDALEGLDTAVLTWGVLGDAERSRNDPGEVRRILRTNLVAPAELLTVLAQLLEPRRAGTIVVLSSVAGDRGRQSNYVYGASKGGLSVLLQGLRNRLHDSGVRVLTVKPGIVVTPMTERIEHGMLSATAERVARGIHGALQGRRDVVYVPGFWRPLMAAIRAVPERFFKRTKL